MDEQYRAALAVLGVGEAQVKNHWRRDGSIVIFADGERHQVSLASLLGAEGPAAEIEPEPTPEIDATAAAIARADERGIDLAGVAGSGKGGRILVRDVEAYNAL